MRANHLLILFSGLTILLWGIWGFFGKLALEKRMMPLAIFAAEVVVSLLCLIILFITVFQKENLTTLYNSWNIFGLVSGAALALGLLFYYFALNKGQVTIVVPLTAAYPVASALLSYAILGERPRWIQWIGILFVVFGIVLLLSGPVTKTSNEQEAMSPDVTTSKRPSNPGAGNNSSD